MSAVIRVSNFHQKEYVALIDHQLNEYLPEEDLMQADLINAMEIGRASCRERV